MKFPSVKSVSPQLLPRMTAPISAVLKNGDTSIGTGFFYYLQKDSVDVMVVTNRHVIEDAVSISLHIDVIDMNGNSCADGMRSVAVTVQNPPYVFHPDESVDLAMFPLTLFVGVLPDIGKMAHIATLDTTSILTDQDAEFVSPVMSILMTGYPAGLYDTVNNRPIIRTGITATDFRDNYEGQPEFMIDCACYPGSSGSPIFIDFGTTLQNHQSSSIILGKPLIALAGILYGGADMRIDGPVSNDNGETSNTAHILANMNLGHCIKASEIKTIMPLGIAICDAMRANYPHQRGLMQDGTFLVIANGLPEGWKDYM